MKTQETITWHLIEDGLPHTYQAVLVFTPTLSEPVCPAFWDGEYWRDVDAMPLENKAVKAWADMPEGPK